MGRDGEGVPVRRRRRRAHPRRALRRPLTAAGLPLHVRPDLRGGVPHLLFDGRWPGWAPAAPACPRRDAATGLAGAYGAASGLQAADGLEHPLGLVGEQRLQLRRRRLTPRGAGAREHAPRGRPAADRRSERHGHGTNLAEYIAEIPAMSAFMLEDGAVYQTYGTTFRGVEFLMGYYPILDRAP